jgi:hypothetical protein
MQTALSAAEKVSLLEAENDLHEVLQYAKEMVKPKESVELVTNHQPLWNFKIKPENFSYLQSIGKLDKMYYDDSCNQDDHFDYRNFTLKVIRTEMMDSNNLIKKLVFISSLGRSHCN